MGLAKGPLQFSLKAIKRTTPTVDPACTVPIVNTTRQLGATTLETDVLDLVTSEEDEDGEDIINVISYNDNSVIELN